MVKEVLGEGISSKLPGATEWRRTWRMACSRLGMLSSDLVLLQWEMGSQRMFLSGGMSLVQSES